jgi:hypothetical protein
MAVHQLSKRPTAKRPVLTELQAAITVSQSGCFGKGRDLFGAHRGQARPPDCRAVVLNRRR